MCIHAHAHVLLAHQAPFGGGPRPLHRTQLARSWSCRVAARPGRTRRAADARAHTKARGSGGDLVLSRKGWSLVSKRQERRDVKGAAERPCGMAMGKLVCCVLVQA